jgi:hypothetical protein
VHMSSEWRTEDRRLELTPAIGPDTKLVSHSWFVSGSYRVAEKVELGTYYSRFVHDTSVSASLDDNHMSGPAVSGRVDLNRFWHVKAEAHFIDGYGNPQYARGFYVRDNTNGFSESTRMLVLRTGITF